MRKTWIDLLTIGGELVRIEGPQNLEDEIHESIENAMKRKDWWCPNQFEHCSATYLGLHINRVNMALIIGSI